MTRKQQEDRLHELQKKIGILEQQILNPDHEPGLSGEEMVELHELEKLLGYR